jgi:hypothetical protein
MFDLSISPFAQWMLSRMASKESGPERPFDFEAHGCYDMGYDCDSTSISG